MTCFPNSKWLLGCIVSWSLLVMCAGAAESASSQNNDTVTSPGAIYDRPSADRIIADLKAHCPDRLHPRIYASPATFESLKKGIKTDPYLQAHFKALQKNGEQLLKDPAPVVAPDINLGGLLMLAKKVLDREQTLGLLYRLTGDKRYAERAYLELVPAAKLPDWNAAKHFLDTAEMCAAFGIAYDWMYDYWTEEQKSLIRTAVVNLALQPGMGCFDGKIDNSWVKGENNWVFVCNGGLAVGALAIGDEEEGIAGQILARGLRSMEGALKEFAPEGGWEEGVGYWKYGMDYLIKAMSSYEIAAGTDYGILKTKGLSTSWTFPVYLTGTSRHFNFHDSGSGSLIDAPDILWLAHHFNQPDVAAFYFKTNQIQRTPANVKEMLWYSPPGDVTPATLPLDKLLPNVEVASFRTDWYDPNAMFAALQGGDNHAHHGHLDMGTFVIESNGVQWAIDLGPEKYGVPGYFGKERNTYYRIRPEGHNTLVFNPTSQPGQALDSWARISNFQSTPEKASAQLNMTESYPEARRVIREMQFLRQQRQVMLQDDIELKKPSELYWFMHTRAEVQLQDGGRKALLKQEGKEFHVQILSPENAKFVVMEARPLTTSPASEKANPNKDMRKLAIHQKDVSSERISVLFSDK